MEKYFKALASRRRIDLIRLLKKGELKLEVIVEKTKMPYKTVFRNLSVLRTAGFIESRILYGSVYFRLKSDPNPIARRLAGLINDKF